MSEVNLVDVQTKYEELAAADSTAGWTKIMYAMVMNVVRPPIISWLTEVSFSFSLNNRSSMVAPPQFTGFLLIIVLLQL